MNRKGILLVDDEAMTLKYFSRSFGERFAVHAAGSAQEALEILASHRDHIGVVVTDQRMPESTGLDLLAQVRDLYPDTVRILTTAYSEFDLLVAAINAGTVHSFVSKPWELRELEEMLLRSLAHHETQVQHSHLVSAKLAELKSQLLEERVYDIGLIAAKLGHYIHNALCPLTFLLDQLLDKSKSQPRYSEEFLRSVRAHTYEVARTLKNLEDISVPATRFEYETLNLEELLAKALEQTAVIREQKRLHIDQSIMRPLPPIRGVPSQIEMLFRFMIAEEVVSLPHGSRVSLGISPHEADGEVLGLNVDFQDFEPVASEMNPQSLLHPFNLRGANPREFGIFLVSCYFIARHHGGSLHARVKEDRGLSFSFFLPRDPAEAFASAEGPLGGFSFKPGL